MKQRAFWALCIGALLWCAGPVSTVYASSETSSVPDYLGSRKHFRYGFGVRGGMFFIPEWFLTGLFFDEGVGVINGGFSVEFILRATDTFEYGFGVGWYNLRFAEGLDKDGQPIPHIFLNKGNPPSEREFVENELSYIALDVRFIKHFPLHKHMSFFVGGGIGLGIVLGYLT
ncbi:MAG: hypothetical protein AAGJ35_06655, partial [Myxococcota bacterium]